MPELQDARLREVTLALFFTRRTGLFNWDRVGNLDREVELYARLQPHLRRVNFITYGGGRDQSYSSAISPILVHPVPRHLPVFASRRILQTFYRSALRESDIFKTNQVAGAEIATWLKRKFKKKLITRCGYLYSRFMAEQARSRYRIRRAYAIEKAAFTVADAVAVTSSRDREWAIENHNLHPDKVWVVPNYVITDIFKPNSSIQKTHDIVCVAKAGPQKNLGLLFQTLHDLKRNKYELSCMLIGSAAADQKLRQQATDLNLDVSFVNRVSNFRLPEYFNRCRAFVITSLYEGHPKALLEAMSCGLPCIGTDVVGVRDDLEHLENGYLSDAQPDSLASAIREVLEDAGLQQKLGNKARQYVKARYDINKVLGLELQLVRSLL